MAVCFWRAQGGALLLLGTLGLGLAVYGAAEQPASQEAKKAPKAAKKEAPPKKAPEYTKDEVKGGIHDE